MKPELETQYLQMINHLANDRPDAARAELSNILTGKLADRIAVVNQQIASTHAPAPAPATQS